MIDCPECGEKSVKTVYPPEDPWAGSGQYKCINCGLFQGDTSKELTTRSFVKERDRQ